MEIAPWIQKILDTTVSDSDRIQTSKVVRSCGPNGTFLVSTDRYRLSYFKINDNKQADWKNYSLQTGEEVPFCQWHKVAFVNNQEPTVQFTIEIQNLKDALHALMCVTRNLSYRTYLSIKHFQVPFKVLNTETNEYEEQMKDAHNLVLQGGNSGNVLTVCEIPILFTRLSPCVDNDETITLNVKQLLELLPSSAGKMTGVQYSNRVPYGLCVSLSGPTRPVSIEYVDTGPEFKALITPMSKL
jgi:hypothetical protein